VRTKRETVEASWDASAKSDYATAGACVASGYTSIDHHRGVTATTMEQLLGYRRRTQRGPIDPSTSATCSKRPTGPWSSRPPSPER
jgi:hypothetical protein